MNTKEIERHVEQGLTWELVVPNIYLYHWESDLFGITPKTRYAVEVEIKTSRADYKKDFTKLTKHCLLENYRHGYITWRRHGRYRYERTPEGIRKYQYATSLRYLGIEQAPNRFYYAVPEGLIVPEEVPHYAGLIYVKPTGGIKKVKNAPLLHKNPFDNWEGLAKKFYWKWKRIPDPTQPT